jgi:hypothetical protein
LTQRTSLNRSRLAFAASAIVYLIASVVMGHDSVQHLSTTIQHDAGDPLLTAAILHWTTTHVPLTDGWWQFPIFYPTRDALAFSEHLLGLSVVATPIEWVTHDSLVTYNLVALLTNPLCGVAMYALVWRLTRNASAAFLAGLAYAFAPYRVSQAPHIQMLAVFWAPIALLGLHAYLETRNRRWLIVYGAAWLLQLLANNYYVFFFSLLIGLWVAWFVLARRDWRALGAITLATVIAALPLAPILYKYLEVHTAHAFVRNLDEIQFFSADVGAVLCAPALLTFWGWVRIECRPEGELFPGVALVLLSCVAGLAVIVMGMRTLPAPRRAILVRRVCLVIGGYYLVVVCSILLFGPWRFFIGPLAVSARSMGRPVAIGAPALTIAFGIWLWFKRQSAAASALTFYVLSAIVLWTLSWGPHLRWMEQLTDIPGPFSLLMYVPGVNGLRVPARFWALAVLCLSVGAGIVVAELFAKRSRIAAALTPFLAIALLTDGWAYMPAAPAPTAPVRPSDVAGRLVMTLPVDDVPTDIAATYHAAVGGWRSVNGYSGYITNYYPAMKTALETQDPGLFTPFQAYGELDVLVPAQDTAINAFLREQPAAHVVARTDEWIDYRLPRAGAPTDGRSAGSRVAVASVMAECGRESLPMALDGVRDTGWTCYSEGGREQIFDIDLGRLVTVGSVVMSLAQHYDAYPSTLELTTSLDGIRWEPAFSGSLLAQMIRGGLEDPESLRLTVPIAPRLARHIRMRHPAAPKPYYWWMSELEVWSGNTNPKAQNPNPNSQ